MKPGLGFRFRMAPLGVLVFGLTLGGCSLLDDILPTSATDERTEQEGSESSGSSAPSSSPDTATPYPVPGVGVQAPTIVSPAPGSLVSEARPTLTLANASTDANIPLTYSFDLAEDEGFEQMVASARGIEEGAGEQTSWNVPDDLEPGVYNWRAQARAGYSRSPYSSVADFTVIETPPVSGPTGGVAEVFDPLTEGTSLGEVHGGTFTPEGWEVKHKSDYIRYEVVPIDKGFVEWDNLGLQETNPSQDQYMLFGMWDPTGGDYRENPFRVHLQKLDTNHNPPYVRLRWISDGKQYDAGYNFKNWNPDRTYHWRIEWGPGGSAQQARVLLDDGVVIEQDYYRPYQPAVHWVELGIAERAETVVGVVFSNLRIGRK